MDNTNDFIFKFKEHLKIINRSPATITLYAEHIKLFLIAIDEPDIKKIYRRMIEDYIVGLYKYRTKENKPYKISTISTRVRSIKRFFEFLEQTNEIFIDPAEHIKEPKKDKGIIKDMLSKEEVNKILDQPNLGTRKGIRDRAILEVFYSTGIRIYELCKLSIYDLDMQGRLLRINQGKGRKDRVVPIGKHAIRFLREYISKVRPHFTRKNRKNRNLFVDHSGRPISNQVVGVIIKQYVRDAKIRKHVTAHTFRHTFASLLIKNGADIVAVQKMLGHTELRTTQIYIRSLGIDLKKGHNKSHPREKDKAKRSDIKPNIKRIRPIHEKE